MNKNIFRRSNLISPWGIGAIVPFPNNESLMIAGLDMWRYRNPNDFIIEDERLQKRIGVKELRWPPDYREKISDSTNFGLTIPAVRFPRWYYCPFCGEMKKTSLYEQHPTCSQIKWKEGRICKYPSRMIPERFVVICEQGHIDDFPIEEWVHYGSGLKFNKETCHIRRSTGGSSSALSGVIYKCSCGAQRSIAGAMRPSALKAIGYKCRGLRPWLGEDESANQICDCENFQVSLSGDTNVWFPNTISSIYIPTTNESTSKLILDIIDDYYDVLSVYKEDAERYKEAIFKVADKQKVDKDSLYSAFIEKDTNCSSNSTNITNEDKYRFDEYKVFLKNNGNSSDQFHSINLNINDNYDKILLPHFASISLIKKLKETRAFVGFSRIKSRNISEIERKELLRLGKETWLPAIQVQGEGIFIEFNKESLNMWADTKEVQDRVKILNNSYKKSFWANPDEADLRPQFVLLHTFSHILINQLSLECGYSTSSIRERIYCEKTDNKYDMCGILIYTASGDSEGSLGGLVNQGRPGKLENIITSAIKNAAWCSSDPICIQSLGQGPESCNLAACYNCALLPETCCEFGNRLLDRGLLVGTLSDKTIGFFSEYFN